MQQKPVTSAAVPLALPAFCHLSSVQADASAQTFLEFLEESIQVRAGTGLNPLWQVDSSTAEKKYSCGSFSIINKTQATKGAAPCFEITYQKISDSSEQKSAQQAAFKKLFEGLTNPLMTMNCQISSEKDLQQLREFIDLAQKAAPTGVTLQWDFSQVKLTGKDPALNTLKSGYEAIINPLSQLPASRKLTPTPIPAPQPVTANPQRNAAGIAMSHGAAQAAKGALSRIPRL